MIKLNIFYFIFLNIILLINNSSILQPEEAINELNDVISLNKIKMEFIIKLFEEVYAYNELLKNPPQPLIYQNDYFKQYNIKEELAKLDIKTPKNGYTMYREIKIAFANIKDPNIKFQFINNFIEFDFYDIIFPVKFSIVDNEFGKKIYCQKYNSDLINKQFKGDIFKTVDLNVNIPIQTINSKDPFEYIETFGEEYYSLRSPHANFAYNFNLINSDKKPTLKYYPLLLKELNDFTVTYDNGASFKTNLIIIRTASLRLLLTNLKQNENKVLDSPFKRRILKEEIFDYSPYSNTNNALFLEDNISGYDYNYNNIFLCKVDKLNEINIYFIKSFSANSDLELNKYMEVIEKCVKLLDSNKYPILVINRLSDGDNLFLSHFLLELISPLTTVNYYGAYRKTSSLSNLKDEDINQDSSISDCSYINQKYLKKKEKLVEYGNGLKDTLSQPIIVKGYYSRKNINNLKSNLKNIRKPTEILVYTDGYSISAAGAFMKYLQYNGGAITASYFSNPIKNNIPFDSGSNPSFSFSDNTLKNMVPDYNNIYNEIKFKIPVGQLFYNINKTIPIEFDINPVDENVNIYNVDENNLTNFIDKGKGILEKYKNNCNPNNTKLVLVTSECDYKFGNKFTHGGFTCDEDGNWTNICKPSYCDIGYILDDEKKECVVDICHLFKEKKEEPMNVGLIILIVFIFLIIIVVLGLVIIRIIGRHSKKYETSLAIN